MVHDVVLSGQLSGRLYNILGLVRDCSNWGEVVLRYTISPKRSITFKFRDGTSRQVENWSEGSWYLASQEYARISRALGDHNNNDLGEFEALVSHVIRMVKSLDATERMKLGGGVGRKEALLFAVIRRSMPKKIIETGVASGISTSFILKALDLNGFGELKSIDFPNFDKDFVTRYDRVIDATHTPPRLGVGWIVPENLRGRWQLTIGKSHDVLPQLTGDVDLFVHDSEHSYANMMFEFEWAHQHLKPQGLLVSDDVLFNDAYSDFKVTHKDMREPFRVPNVGFLRKNKPGSYH